MAVSPSEATCGLLSGNFNCAIMLDSQIVFQGRKSKQKGFSMAIKGRKDGSQTNGNGKGTFRFRYMDSNRQFEVEADDVSGDKLLEGFRYVANAITGRTIAAPAPKQLKQNAGGGPQTEILEDREEEAVETETLPFPDQQDGDEPEEEDTDPIESTPKPKRKVKGPKLLTDLNLTTAKVSLADFMAQKGATDMKDKYAVMAVWYKQQFNITEINIDRIYSAFSHLGQETQLPTDVEKPLKNLTYTKVKKWFDKVDGQAGTYAINWVGEDGVNKMGPSRP